MAQVSSDMGIFVTMNGMWCHPFAGWWTEFYCDRRSQYLRQWSYTSDHDHRILLPTHDTKYLWPTFSLILRTTPVKVSFGNKLQIFTKHNCWESATRAIPLHRQLPECFLPWLTINRRDKRSRDYCAEAIEWLLKQGKSETRRVG